MFALRARWSSLLAEHSAPSRTIRPGTEVPSNSECVHAHASRSAVPCNSRTECERHLATLPSAPCALFLRSFSEEQKLTPLLSGKLPPSRPESLHQLFYLQSFTRPLTPLKILTPTFPSSSALFARSFAKERKLTHVHSCGCARFCEDKGYLAPPKPNPSPANGFRGCYSRSEKKSEGLSEQP
jgi:hypothetical protein